MGSGIESNESNLYKTLGESLSSWRRRFTLIIAVNEISYRDSNLSSYIYSPNSELCPFYNGNNNVRTFLGFEV